MQETTTMEIAEFDCTRCTAVKSAFHQIRIHIVLGMWPTTNVHCAILNIVLYLNICRHWLRWHADKRAVYTKFGVFHSFPAHCGPYWWEPFLLFVCRIRNMDRRLQRTERRRVACATKSTTTHRSYICFGVYEFLMSWKMFHSHKTKCGRVHSSHSAYRAYTGV